MKYLRKFNESKSLSQSDIEDFFAHTFDLADNVKIEEAFFSEKNLAEWAHNDFTNDVDNAMKGFSIMIEHSFYDRMEINELVKFSEMINQLSVDVKRFDEIYKPTDIFLEEAGNSSIYILINP